jgi:transcriptional regulator with XRE-family HTH domain
MGIANPLRDRFGTHVRSLRRTQALTQEELAERAELSVDTIRRIERGDISPSLDTMGKLSGGLRISLETLFQGLESRSRNRVRELCDFLSGLSGGEVKLASRVVRAIFDDLK